MIHGRLPYLRGLKCVPTLLLMEDGVFRLVSLETVVTVLSYLKQISCVVRFLCKLGIMISSTWQRSACIHCSGPCQTPRPRRVYQPFYGPHSPILPCTPLPRPILYKISYHIVQQLHLFSLLPQRNAPNQTGNSVFLLLIPNRSTNTPIYGPTTGKFLTNPAIVPKKSPKRTKIP